MIQDILNDNKAVTGVKYLNQEENYAKKPTEYRTKIARVIKENPDLSYSVVKEILLGLGDIKAGNVEAY